MAAAYLTQKGTRPSPKVKKGGALVPEERARIVLILSKGALKWFYGSPETPRARWHPCSWRSGKGGGCDEEDNTTVNCNWSRSLWVNQACTGTAPGAISGDADTSWGPYCTGFPQGLYCGHPKRGHVALVSGGGPGVPWPQGKLHGSSEKQPPLPRQAQAG